ncbi:MAG: ParB/RepB/Spo0J family partition protein [Clostridia bacterium]|nr:ParB/RepB/Spo0J family partition protein [Clostridia bacterium]
MAKQLTFDEHGLITESELKEDNEYLKEAIKSEGFADGESITVLNVEDVYGNPHQPRKFFDNSALSELAESIKIHGVIQPIVVCKTANKYMIIAGERRFRATKMAGLKAIPAIVKHFSEKQIKEVSLIENLQREDLNPIETAEAMRQLMDEFSLTQEELAERLGKSRSSVANTLRLLSLAPEVSVLVADGKLSAGHARTIISIPKHKQRAFADKIIAEDLSVREVERLVKKYNSPPEIKQQKIKPNLSKELRDMVDRMQRCLGTKVTAIGNDNKGRIYVDYYTRDDLDRICEILEKIEKSNGF